MAQEVWRIGGLNPILSSLCVAYLVKTLRVNQVNFRSTSEHFEGLEKHITNQSLFQHQDNYKVFFIKLSNFVNHSSLFFQELYTRSQIRNYIGCSVAMGSAVLLSLLNGAKSAR